MPVSNIAAASGVSQGAAQGLAQQRRDELRALIRSLKTGDLSGAQQAFAMLQQTFQNTLQAQSGGVSPSGNHSPLQKDLAAIGTALQSGDIAGAQKRLAGLMQDLQRLRQNGGAVGSGGLYGQAMAVPGSGGSGIHVTA